MKPPTPATFAHIGWGLALTLLFARYGPLWLAGVITIAIAIGKESIESIWGVWEPVQPWRDAETDIREFAYGIVAGVFFVSVLPYIIALFHLLALTDLQRD